MLEAHDVSYFTNLGRLRAGDQVLWITPCAAVDIQGPLDVYSCTG